MSTITKTIKVSGYCPKLKTTKTISVDFMTMAGFQDYKKARATCDLSRECSYAEADRKRLEGGCPLYHSAHYH